MSRRIAAFLVITLVMVLGACRMLPEQTAEAIEPSTYERIQKMLTELETYRSVATVEYISNKGRNTYEVLQQGKTSGEYRVEVLGPENVAGNITISDGVTIYQFNPRISGTVSVGIRGNQERSEIFITSFIKNYLSSEEVSVSVGSFGEGNCTVLEASIPGDHPYLHTEKLWIDNDTLMPVRLSIYDPDGGERIVVNFKTFEYNVELDDELFRFKS